MEWDLSDNYVLRNWRWSVFANAAKTNCCYSELWQYWETDTLVGQQCKDCSNDLGDKTRDVDRVYMDTNGGLEGDLRKKGWNDIMKYTFWK